MAISGIDGNLIQNGTQAKASAAASRVNGQLNTLSETSEEKEFKDAIKSFETYFAEQVLKEMKESFTKFGEDDKEDTSVGQIKDYFMDSVYTKLADDLVEDVGQSLTQQLYEQMKRNYNLE